MRACLSSARIARAIHFNGTQYYSKSARSLGTHQPLFKMSASPASPTRPPPQPLHSQHPASHPTGVRLASTAEGTTGETTTASPNCYGFHITSCMDAGNIEVLGAPDDSTINLAIRPDPYCASDSRAHYQLSMHMWFNFRLVGAAGRQVRLRIVNAGGASYAPAWLGYRACASYDLQDWFRVPTNYDPASGVLTITHTPQQDAVQYAYFAPYSLDRHAALLARMQGRSRPDLPVRLRVLGRSLEGRDLEMLEIGPSAPTAVAAASSLAEATSPAAAAPSATSSPSPGPCPPPLRVWVICRQHPGESMAEWFAEGLLERLTDPEDSVARCLGGKACFYVVPNMCPDGSARGHLRTNAAGTNLNRAWAAPSLEAAPEVLHTLAAMDKTGVDLFLDIHGDEELPHVFVAGLEGLPGWGPRLAGLQTAFCAAAARHAPEFQTAHGYARDAPGRANLTLASKQVGHRFDCLSLTLEMPFKDSLEVPDPRVGWSPGRAKRLGAALLGAINDIAHLLRQSA
ncbi:hypothetical protein Agub_g5139 [Astrephomene gubernaculifera]|uniref:Peptidase M14 domain-containing protein n=1 Tax=Astrephomene gubernaculifera TaxID=47775 RepID=A0AAD3DLU4_9CHLO|nr:hypothetical protein Agub_g5139 [Astrephomene gubernaculifera]